VAWREARGRAACANGASGSHEEGGVRLGVWGVVLVVCVCRCRGWCSLSVCVCDLLIFLHEAPRLNPINPSKILTEPHTDTGREKPIPALPQGAANPVRHEVTQAWGAKSPISSSESRGSG